MGPKAILFSYFVAWKSLILLIAFLSPGPGYDTSTNLIVPETSAVAKLVRWDAVYFTQIARRHYVFEQEWAFGWGFTRLLAFLASHLRFLTDSANVDTEAWVGVGLAHVSHLSSVLVLYKLSLAIFGRQKSSERIAFLSACLHIISPAGVFLSAPYGESPFSCLQFAGLYLYVLAIQAECSKSTAKGAACRLSSGLSFGLATLIRSNGLLSGMIFAYDAVVEASFLIRANATSARLQRLACTVLAGSFIATGVLLPQYLAYREHCIAPSSNNLARRPWCNRLPPSIYTFVQSHYWNVGFLRYWTISNMPLFLLATPILVILLVSSMWAWGVIQKPPILEHNGKGDDSSEKVYQPREIKSLLSKVALPQAVLAVLAITNYHVQVITRLSSGYPVWYWWLACAIIDRTQSLRPSLVVRWMTMYGMIQGGLFASFLPPA